MINNYEDSQISLSLNFELDPSDSKAQKTIQLHIIFPLSSFYISVFYLNSLSIICLIKRSGLEHNYIQSVFYPFQIMFPPFKVFQRTRLHDSTIIKSYKKYEIYHFHNLELSPSGNPNTNQV